MYSISYLPEARHIQTILFTNSAHIISKIIPTTIIWNSFMRNPSSLNFHWRAALAFPLHDLRSLSHLTVKFTGNYRSCISRFLIHWSIPRALKWSTNIIRKHKRELWFYIDLQTPLVDTTAGRHATGGISLKNPVRLIYGNVSTQLAEKFRQIWEDAFGKLLEFSISAFLVDWQSRCRRFK